MKKFIICILLLLSFSFSAFAQTEAERQKEIWENASPESKQAVMKDLTISAAKLEANLNDGIVGPITEALEAENQKQAENQTQAENQKQEENQKQAENQTQEDIPEKDKFDSPEFEIPVTEFSPLWVGIAKGASTEAQANSILASIIRFLMILIWSCSLLVMTVGGWYMIVYHGNDEFLSRWKTIFWAGASGLAVALFSYYLVDLVSKLVY